MDSAIVLNKIMQTQEVLILEFNLFTHILGGLLERGPSKTKRYLEEEGT